MADATTTTKVECYVCHGKFAERYLGNHLRAQHNIYGGRTGRVRKQIPKRIPAAVRAVAVPVPINPPVESRPRQSGSKALHVQSSFIVLTDDDGGVWIAERVR